MNLQNFLSYEGYLLVQELTKTKSVNFQDLKLKSPKIALFLSVFFGYLGADRFYKGDKFLAFVKLFGILMPIVFGFFGIEKEMIIYASFFLWVFCVWYILDFALVFYGVKKDNCDIIIAFLRRAEND